MKKILFIFLSVLMCISQAKAETTLALECSTDLVADYSDNLPDTGDGQWVSKDKKSYFLLTFTKPWEQLEGTCKPYAVVSFRQRFIKILEEVTAEECDGFLSDDYGWTLGETETMSMTAYTSVHYNRKAETCKVTYTVIHNNAVPFAIETFDRENCDMAKSNFERQIFSDEITRNPIVTSWRKKGCRIIGIPDYEEKVRMTVDEMQSILKETVL